MEEKIKVDKKFLFQILESLTDLKERMNKCEQGSKNKEISTIDKNNPVGFTLECNLGYSGVKDETKERQFIDELRTLMVKFGLVEVKAILSKGSKFYDGNNSTLSL